MWPVLALLCLLLLLVLLTRRTVTEGFAETIFVSIGSYRDEECLRTVRDAFAKADTPSRVHVGVCEQNKEEAEACGAVGAHGGQVRTITLDYTAAKGPTFARHLCNTLYEGEDYLLQIDSHTRFVQGWDSRLIAMLQQCPAAKPVLTHYPLSYEPASDDLPSEMLTHVPVMCRSKWNGDGLPTFEAVMQPVATAGLRRVPFMAGGMLFASGRVFQEVALDPGLDYLFQAEEALLSARLYTHGWDLFTPSENVVLHFYERKGGPRFWDDITGYREKQLQTLQRVKSLLALEAPDLSLADPYGMGRERTLAQWWGFSGLDPVGKTSSSAAVFCP